MDALFACSRKDRLTARSGSPYLALELRDRSGSIPARAFRDADFLAGRFERGDIVRVKGRVERFRDELQIEVESIERAEDAGPGRLPARWPTATWRSWTASSSTWRARCTNRACARLLAAFLDDPAFREALRRAPCTRGGHHAYLGGLLEHTVAVATLALETCTLHPRLNSDVLLTAAILHDIGKTREFELGADIALSDEGEMLGHVTLGQRDRDGARPGRGRRRARAAAGRLATASSATTARRAPRVSLGRGAGARTA